MQHGCITPPSVEKGHVLDKWGKQKQSKHFLVPTIAFLQTLLHNAVSQFLNYNVLININSRND